MAPQDDLTAERAAQLTQVVVMRVYQNVDDHGEVVDCDVVEKAVNGYILAEMVRTRQEALRECARQARFGAMELRAMNEPLGTDRLGYGQKALQDFADMLDRLASEGA